MMMIMMIRTTTRMMMMIVMTMTRMVMMILQVQDHWDRRSRGDPAVNHDIAYKVQS